MASSDNLKSLSWISTKQTATKTSLVVNSSVSKRLQTGLGEHECNFVSIFGAAREGKSFLMNCLANRDELFRTANTQDPCTQGVDMSNYFMPVSTFATIADVLPGAHAATRKEGIQSPYQVGFLDVEGQGDRDVSYDANLICPVLLASKCVLFNWKGSLQKDKILNLLGIMYKAALHVAPNPNEGEEAPVLGHLHVIFRDWQHTGTPDSVKDALFKKEARSAEADARLRNAIRDDLAATFKSITVWLLPAPSVKVVSGPVADSFKLGLSECSSEFKMKVHQLRRALVAQLSDGPTFFAGSADITLTGNNMGRLVTEVVSELNQGNTIQPQSAYVNMKKQEVLEIRASFEEKLGTAVRDLLGKYTAGGASAAGNAAVLPTQHQLQEAFSGILSALEVQLKVDLNEVVGGLAGTPYEAELLIEISRSQARLTTDAQARLLAGYEKLQRDWFSAAVGRCKREIDAIVVTTAPPDASVGVGVQPQIEAIVERYAVDCAQVVVDVFGLYSSAGGSPSKRMRTSSSASTRTGMVVLSVEETKWLEDAQEVVGIYSESRAIQLRARLGEQAGRYASLLAASKTAIQVHLEGYMNDPARAQGFLLADLMVQLNEAYFQHRDQLKAAVVGSGSGSATPLRADSAALRDAHVDEFHTYCQQLNQTLKSQYTDRQHKAIAAAVQASVAQFPATVTRLGLAQDAGAGASVTMFEELLASSRDDAINNIYERCGAWQMVHEAVENLKDEAIDETEVHIDQPICQAWEPLAAKAVAALRARTLAQQQRDPQTQEQMDVAPAESKPKPAAKTKTKPVPAAKPVPISPTPAPSLAPVVVEARAKSTGGKLSVAEQRARARAWAGKDTPVVAPKSGEVVPLASSTGGKLSVAEQRRRAAEWHRQNLLDNANSASSTSSVAGAKSIKNGVGKTAPVPAPDLSAPFNAIQQAAENARASQQSRASALASSIRSVGSPVPAAASTNAKKRKK